MTADPDQRAFIERAGALSPAIQNAIVEDAADLGQVEPYGILGIIARHVIDLYRMGPQHREEIQRILDFFESEYARGPDSVREIIHLGFLENLGGPPEDGWRTRDLLGPQLRKAIEVIWPSSGYARKHRRRRAP